MNCPVCKNSVLVSFELRPTVTAQKCPACGGQWLGSLQFDKWIEAARTGGAGNTAASAAPSHVTELKGIRICPECGHFMARFKVGASLAFTLDRCGNCGGTWFDQNEWEILQGSEVWDQIHLIFSPAWQARIRHAGQVEHLQALFAERVGAADFAEAKRVKAWLEKHPHREAILGYLHSDEN